MYRKESVPVQGSPMDILVFEPEGAGPHPGIVVAQHLPVAHEGLEKDPFTIDVGERLAAAGFACVIPFVFHWWTPETDIQVKRDEFDDARCVADMQAGYDLLTGLDSVDSARIGIMGHCWGGRVSWLASCHNPNYKALATLYGGRIELAMGGDGTPPIDLTANIPCPVLGIFGNDDKNPSPEQVDNLEAALKAAGKEYAFHRYDGAGHGFQDFVNPDRYRETQAEDAWEKVLVFLKDRLS